MSWEREIFGLFDELERRAEELFDAERQAELVDRARAEYRQVTLSSRLIASTDAELIVEVAGPGQVRGRLRSVGAGWCLLAGHGDDWVICLDAIRTVTGASARSVPEAAWTITQRLGLASVLRRLADAGERCIVHLRDGGRYDVRLTRVGADFVEATTGSGSGSRTVLVALAGLAALQSPGAG